MTQFKKHITSIVNKYIALLSNAIVAELNTDWAEYIRYLKNLPEKEQKNIIEIFKVSSLDDINVEIISKDISKEIISVKFGINRPRDARILEYIYGKRTPLGKLITKLNMPNGISMLINRHSKI